MEQEYDHTPEKSKRPEKPRWEPTSASTPSLRFPRPQGNRHLANWISNSSPDIMSPSNSSDDGNLGESSYELINSTDGESQDDRMTESISSLDYPRTDDVESLNGSDNDHGYQTDSDEDAEQHSSSSIRYADQALQKPSTPPPAADLQLRPAAAQSTAPPNFIEFSEGEVDPAGPIFLDKISVKHTIREFDEAETATILQGIPAAEAPERLVATIRQTMSLGYLSSKEPLRVLYVGNPVARMDIIYKISSAICASGSNDGTGKTVNQSTEGVFNIFPISDFGSSNLPDVHLLESSGRQIRVEDCTSAEETVIGGGSFPGDTVYSLTVDREKTYQSLFTPSGSAIQPKWDAIPHIAVFFCAETDDAHARETRRVARQFMNRHGVPSIVVSNNQQFFTPHSEEPLVDAADQHAVHLCLESGDSDRPAFSKRLPIDLVSFLNIDARQMNRHLTYLTGLAELRDLAQSEQTITVGSQHYGNQATEELQDSACKPPPTIFHATRSLVCDYIEQYPQLLSASLIFTAIASVLVAVALASTQLLSPIQSLGPSTVSPGNVPAASSAVSTAAQAATTTTIKINVTSTRTVKAHSSEASASTLASALSFAGFLSDKASSALSDSQPRTDTYSVEIYSDNEILVRIPTSRKTAWLAKGAIDVDVYRGSESVKTKLSSADEGILVEINKKDAYGVLNVSVVTTRRPKINETFEVDFGRQALTEAFDTGLRVVQAVLDDVARSVNEGGNMLSPLAIAAQGIREDATRAISSLEEASRAAHGSCDRLVRQSITQVKRSLDPNHVTELLKRVRGGDSYRFISTEELREEINFSIYKAQVASKLWWLKLQGRAQEHADYEQKATRFLRDKYEDLTRNRETRSQNSRPNDCDSCKKRRSRKGCCSQAKSSAGERIWKKMITG